MKKPKPSRVITLLLLCVAVAVLFGWRVHTLNQRRSLPFPLSGEPLVGRRLYSVPEPNGPPESAPRIHDWKVIGDPVDVSPELAAELRDILSSPSTYMFSDSTCFEPGMAISFGSGPDHVDVLICLLCNRAVFYRGDASQGRRISEEGNKRLSSFYQRLFNTPPPQL